METKYHFTYIKSKTFNVATDKNAMDYLLKWSMKDQLHLASFSFNEPFESYQKNEFAKDFFSNAEVKRAIAERLPSWSYENENVDSVETESVPCTQLSMNFFDRILDPKNNIVRSGGSLRQCLDDVVLDFVVSDELHKMLIDDSSDNYSLYDENERKELIFRILQHFVLGGKWCQFEDKIDPYLLMTKMLYKDLVQVERERDSKDIKIRSVCMKVRVKGNKSDIIFPRDGDHVQNFVYLLIDPVLRLVTLVFHQFGGQFK